MRFHVENCQHADQKQLTRRLAFDLDIEATHRQPASCRARPVNVDDGLEVIRRIRGLGGEKLPAASNAPLSNLKRVGIILSTIFMEDMVNRTRVEGGGYSTVSYTHLTLPTTPYV